jgi:hypothetical protein
LVRAIRFPPNHDLDLETTMRHTILTLVLGAPVAYAQHASHAPASHPTDLPSPEHVWADVDRDGLPDLLVVRPGVPASFLRSLGGGRFADATADVGLHGLEARLARASDFDGDGDSDLLVVSLDGARILENEGGLFRRSSALDGLPIPTDPVRAGWVDFDADGRPDVELSGRSGELTLLRNRDDGSFEHVELGLAASARVGAVPEPAAPLPSAAEDAGAAECGESTRRPVPTELGPDDSAHGTFARAGEPPLDASLPIAPDAACTAGAIAFPACALALRDQDGTGCLRASSDPTLGMLYPLSSDFFVEAATGFVGLGTTNPVTTLDIRGGGVFLDGNVTLADDTDTIRFSNSSGTNQPMIEMFDNVTNNVDRMVLGHSAAFQSWGLEYEDVSDRFVFQRSKTEPVFTIDLPNGDLLLSEPGGTLQFPAVSGVNTPMISMFASGTANADRMVVGHSPSAPLWGLEYSDANDVFRFRTNAGSSVEIDLGQSFSVGVPSFHYAPTVVQDTSPGTGGGPVLDVQATQASYPLGQLNRIHRTTTHGTSNDLLEMQIPTGSSTASQYIECQESNGDVNFRVDGGGEIFSDVGLTTPADFAEMIQVTSGAESVVPGDVVVIDPLNPRAVVKSSGARSSRVLGVYSTKPGIVGSEREWDVEAPEGSTEALQGERIVLDRSDMARLYGEVPVAMIGIVPTKVSAENGPIRPGDLLVTSGTPGHAMRDDHPLAGTVVGKALESLDSGTGTIRIAVALQ